jgi:uncharacterized membrane protein
MRGSKKKFTAVFRDNFLAGVLVLAPFSVVLWITIKIWFFLFSLNSLVPEGLNPRTYLWDANPILLFFIDGALTLLIVSAVCAAIYFVGLISRNYIGDKLIRVFRSMVWRIPVLKTVYSTLEQLIQTFTSDKSKNFRRVVEIDYPRKGLRTLALVTGEREGGVLTIFVPTTPNPTSGFYLRVPEADVTNLDMTVEEALKEIISMGLVHRDGDK